MNDSTLPLLAAQVFGVPLLIEQRRLDALLAYLGPRMGAGLPLGDPAELHKRSEAEHISAVQMAAGDVKVYRSDKGYLVAGGTAIVPVMGPLVPRAGMIDASCTELTSYQRIGAMLTGAMDDDAVTNVLLEIDSPGGHVSGAFDLADRIYSMRGKKPMTAVANEYMASAAYLIGSAADEIVLTRTASVGSIGVVTAHVDRSKQLASEGIAVTYIYAGDKKIDGTPYKPLPASVKADIQGEVDKSYRLLVDTVARNRGIKADAVRNTQAGMFSGDAAVAVGLADRVESFAAELGNQV